MASCRVLIHRAAGWLAVQGREFFFLWLPTFWWVRGTIA